MESGACYGACHGKLGMEWSSYTGGGASMGICLARQSPPVPGGSTRFPGWSLIAFKLPTGASCDQGPAAAA